MDRLMPSLKDPRKWVLATCVALCAGCASLSLPDGQRIASFPPYRVAFSQDGKHLAASGGSFDQVVVFDAATLRPQRRLTVANAPSLSILFDGPALAFSPDSQFLAANGLGDTTVIWNVETGAEALRLSDQKKANELTFSPDGGSLAVTGPGALTTLWNVSDGRKIGELVGHAGIVSSVVFSPDGKLLATGSLDRTVRIWDAATQQSLRIIKGHEGPVYSVAFSPDGAMLATSAGGYDVRLWDAASGDAVQPVTDVKAETDRRQSLETLAVIAGLIAGIRTVQITGAPGPSPPFNISSTPPFCPTPVRFSPDGRFLVAIIAQLPRGTGANRLYIFDSLTKQTRQITHAVLGCGLAVSSDSTRVATSAYFLPPNLWDLRTGEQVNK